MKENNKIDNIPEALHVHCNYNLLLENYHLLVYLTYIANIAS